MSDFIHQFVPGPEPVTVLALHGTGGNESNLIALAQGLLPGANVLSPRGHISENGAARFFRRLAEGVFDIENLHDETGQLADFVADASGKYGFDPAKVVALGYSNGANIAASLLLSRPETLAGAVLLRAMTPFMPEQLPNLSGKPIFLAAGQMDPLVSMENITNLARLFQSAGADVTLRFENAEHHLLHAEIEAARGFCSQKFA